ncbi:MAG: enoyl-CoA hydratase/isomerase family protein [Bacteroidales bacterium]|nr:enoyl-CoA hydratase/isomerase family protein [Bacteroidales bacterium]
MNSRQHIDWKIESEIGFLQFNDPPGNEMTPEFYHQLKLLTSSTIQASKVKAIIIAGSGRHFSSGADLNSLFEVITKDSCDEISKSTSRKLSGSNPKTLSSNLKTFDFFRQLDIPVIAAIRGVCIGAALELAMFCHFRICAKGAVLGLPESTYGLITGIGGIQNLVALAGQAKAMELVLKGNTLSAHQALNWKIVDYVVPKKELIEIAIMLAGLSAPGYRKYLKKDYLRQLEIDK